MSAESGQFIETLIYFPEEVWIQIFIRLPPKSLLRFKSVCKAWCALIGCSYFVNRHLDFTKTIIDRDCHHLVHHFAKPRTTPTMAGAVMRLGRTADEFTELEGAPCLEQGDHQLGLHGCTFSPFGHCRAGSAMWGPVNGVYCVMIKAACSGRCTWEKKRYRCTILLWNPGNGQVHVLPEIPPTVFPSPLAEYLESYNFQEQHLVCGYGYNTLTNDHMVILITIHGDKHDEYYHHYSFHLYSLASNTWEHLDPFEIVADTSLIQVYHHGGVAFEHDINMSFFHAWDSGIYCNGACHWLSVHLNGVLSFDFGDVSFRVTSIPRATLNLGGKHVWLATVDGCLAVVCSSGFLSHEFDVAVMEKNDVELSWMIAYRVMLPSLSPGGKFIGIVDDEFFVREDGVSGRVVSYRLGGAEPEKERREYCCVDDKWIRILPYRGSLLPIKPGNNKGR